MGEVECQQLLAALEPMTWLASPGVQALVLDSSTCSCAPSCHLKSSHAIGPDLTCLLSCVCGRHLIPKQPRLRSATSEGTATMAGRQIRKSMTSTNRVTAPKIEMPGTEPGQVPIRSGKQASLALSPQKGQTGLPGLDSGAAFAFNRQAWPLERPKVKQADRMARVRMSS